MIPSTRGARRELLATVLGSVLVVAALVLIWAGRISQGRDLYVSEMGAAGQPTARLLEIALLLIVAGGALIAFAARGIRSRFFLGFWAPAISLWIGCGFFLIASQVPCTTGCPLPLGATFSLQDFVHTLVAVLAFAAACIAMVQIAVASGQRGLATFSLVAGLAVAVIAGAGGILSLLRVNVGLGSRFELAATTVALVWLATLGVMLAVRQWRGTVTLPPRDDQESDVALPVLID
ncbi:hypothetical protein BH09ACT1_BH09ACT1_14250 [soil metagenome]